MGGLYQGMKCHLSQLITCVIQTRTQFFSPVLLSAPFPIIQRMCGCEKRPSHPWFHPNGTNPHNGTNPKCATVDIHFFFILQGEKNNRLGGCQIGSFLCFFFYLYAMTDWVSYIMQICPFNTVNIIIA